MLGTITESPKRHSMARESENELRGDGARMNFGELLFPAVG